MTFRLVTMRTDVFFESTLFTTNVIGCRWFIVVLTKFADQSADSQSQSKTNDEVRASEMHVNKFAALSFPKLSFF